MRTAGIQYYIVDLRYNGGGLVSIAQIMNDLLGGARSTSDVQFHVVYSANKASRNTKVDFQPRPQSVQPVRIAFLTTDGTASASEININTMKPYVETAIVGDDTYGKPVGQEAFDLSSSCPDRLRLITFKTTNSQNQGEYYNGIASSMAFACAATDTLDQPMSSTTDGLTREALHWLGTGACTSVITAATPSGTAKSNAAAAKHYPRSRHPSPAEFWIPGIG
jgi:hypothetical protein